MRRGREGRATGMREIGGPSRGSRGDGRAVGGRGGSGMTGGEDSVMGSSRQPAQ